MAVEIRSAKAAATRDQILDAATRLIHLQGYHDTSLDDVLRESGVGKGNFYYHFHSKEDLGLRDPRPRRRALPRAHAGAVPSSIPRADPLDQIRCLPRSGARGPAPAQLRGRLRPWATSPPSCRDVHEGFRQRLADDLRAMAGDAGDDARSAGASRGGSARISTRPARRGFVVAALEGAILLAKVTKDIAVMEQCVVELKRYLTLYEVRAMTVAAETAGGRGSPSPSSRRSAGRSRTPPSSSSSTFGDRVYRLAIRITGSTRGRRGGRRRTRSGRRRARSTPSRASRRSAAGSTGSPPTPPTRSCARARAKTNEIVVDERAALARRRRAITSSRWTTGPPGRRAGAAGRAARGAASGHRRPARRTTGPRS